ncbi:MAG TPA: ubiquitin-like small modifier protein 1 [Chloroflexota bacterium]|nr:ubiquitin-like small modifier protein 1 [Chloroflexota bacterium]
MAVTVRLPGTLRQWVDGQKAVTLDTAGSVGDTIQALCRSYPQVAERVLDGDGQPRRFVNVYVNGDDIRLLQGTDTPVRDGDELILAPAVAGG